MTWEEVRDLDRDLTVVILPIGALEAHGPHLPLSTDVLIAEAMAAAAAERLATAGREVVILPALAYTPAPFAAGFPGTISLEADTVTRLVREIARSLGAQGFKTLAVANAHLDPTHTAAIHAASDAPEAGSARIVFPDVTRRPWASRLTDEFRSGACHAGRYEGSVVLARAPSLVREEIRRDLPPNVVSISEAIRAGKKTFEEAGGARAYFGAPAEASPEEGRQTIETLGDILAEAVAAETETSSPAEISR